MNGWSSGAARDLLAPVVATFEAEADTLNGLDAKLGDGDHGMSMLTGLRAALKLAEDEPELGPDDFLIRGGKAFNEAAGSTIGILMMSAMKAAGEAIRGRQALGASEVVAMLDAALSAIMARGKAKPGQKTIVDSLLPALEAMRKGQGSSPRAIADAAATAARGGAEATVQMTSAVGRSRWFKERSVGIMDPGAWSGYLLVRTLGDELAGEA